MTASSSLSFSSLKSMQWNERLWQQSQQQLSQFLIPLVEVLGRRYPLCGGTLAAGPAQVHCPDGADVLPAHP
jgi:hypothetical protein